MDRETVIDRLNDMADYLRNKSYSDLFARDFYDTVGYAIALLQEHEAVEGHWIVLEYCANEGIYCSKCHMKIFDRTTKPKKKLSLYCPHCGSRNEQFFKDGEVVFR